MQIYAESQPVWYISKQCRPFHPITNATITVSNIPEKAYGCYMLNGVSAIEWIMDRYQVIIDKDSGIKNDPNDWAKESGNPRYILDLLLSVITVSMKTMDIVESLPRFEC